MTDAYSCSCGNGHCVNLSPTDLEALLDEAEPECSDCDELLELDDELELVCQVCGDSVTVTTLEEAHGVIQDGCASCAYRGTGGSMHVPGSRFFEVAAYEWHRDGRSETKLRRERRKDYWEGLIHFCTREEFISIFRAKRIKASATGFYRHTKPGKAAAVCLTDTPLADCGELADTHGQYGYVFRKKDIIGINGSPAIYLCKAQICIQERAGGFAPDLIPLINLIRIPSAHPGASKVDYLHEREWRVAGDIDLTRTVPFGVVIPGRHANEKFRGPGWQTLLRAAAEYEELETREAREFSALSTSATSTR